jgi:SH3 domain-containing YSC84-like protein 1
MKVRTWTPLIWALGIGTAVAAISTAEAKRLNEAATVVTELRDMTEKGIPGELWDRADCVVVIPNLKKAALGIGGEYGRGVMSCRNKATNGWSAPLFMQLAKGSWGLQIGAEQIDLVLLVMNQRGAEKLLEDKVSLGADASVAAGPVGRSGTASTDAQFSAEILSYSKAQGVFAGIDISGGVLRPDQDANTDVYGPGHNSREIVTGGTAPIPAAARDFVSALSNQARATTGKKPGQ